MNISEHITFEEATKSNKATALHLENKPNDTQLAAMKNVAEYCFEPLRKAYGKPIKINSFFRSTEVNYAVGGKPNSQHLKGEAIDMDAGSREENMKLYAWCKAYLKYDQLIWENDGAWVHISFTLAGNRNQSFNAKQKVK